jgi:hypothetical protein
LFLLFYFTSSKAVNSLSNLSKKFKADKIDAVQLSHGLLILRPKRVALSTVRNNDCCLGLNLAIGHKPRDLPLADMFATMGLSYAAEIPKYADWDP